jgi:hypothetical protein
MKIFVLCDDKGNIQSIAVPNPALADRIHMQSDDGGRVHELDVDESVVGGPEVLRNLTSDTARKQIHDKLRKLI